jgi:hypothetical protein
MVGKEHRTLRHRTQVELAKVCSDFGVAGFLKLPVSQAACRRLLTEWETYHNDLLMEFRRLASERTDDDERIDGIVTELMRLAHAPRAS